MPWRVRLCPLPICAPFSRPSVVRVVRAHVQLLAYAVSDAMFCKAVLLDILLGLAPQIPESSLLFITAWTQPVSTLSIITAKQPTKQQHDYLYSILTVLTTHLDTASVHTEEIAKI